MRYNYIYLSNVYIRIQIEHVRHINNVLPLDDVELIACVKPEALRHITTNYYSVNIVLLGH